MGEGVECYKKYNFKCIIIITHIDELKLYADEIINEKNKDPYQTYVWTNFGDESSGNIVLEVTLIEKNKKMPNSLEVNRANLR